ncbi:MAG: hypothetical protein J2P51_14530 [Hyphomicrobiaceae bacterium]|nr:hypothetical protein [Hyphomicrobiaceae bacterium]
MHEVEVLERVVRTAAAPVHLVGHSFGGLMDRHHYRSFQDMTDSYFAAFAGSDAEASAR